MKKQSAALTLPLSSLTPSGLDAFRKLVSNAPAMPVEEVKKHILEIAGGAGTAHVVSQAAQVPVFPLLKSRQQTAELVTQLLKRAGIDGGPSSGHEPLFSWLGLVFLPSLCKRNKSGTLATAKMYRYALTRSGSDFYRHLVACPYWLFRQYGKCARIFLSQDAFVMPEVVEQIVSRPFLINSRGVVELIDRLYWDEAKDAPKNGFTATTRLKNPPPGFASTSPKEGTLRAFEWTLGQLQCTYDLQSMAADQISNKLPSEFNEWLAKKK